LPDCVPDLKRLVEHTRADLLVLDPLSAFLPPALATSDHRIRQALAPLSAAAAETGCAVLLVRCPERSVGPNAVYRGAGSAGALGVALTGMLLAQHPEEPDLTALALTKAHLGQMPPALGFRLETDAARTVLYWSGVVDLSANELCVPRTAGLVRGPRQRAVEFLKRILQNGPCSVSRLQELAAKRGLIWRTVERAKRTLNIRTEHLRETGWRWRLPADELSRPAGTEHADNGPVVNLIRTGPNGEWKPPS
jgi:hypothetical protein